MTYYVQGYGNAEGYTMGSTVHYEPPKSGGVVSCTVKAITVKTSTPITISTAGKTVSDSIYIASGVKADVTLDNVVITSCLPINIPTNQENPTSLHLTLADGSTNTLTTIVNTTYQFPAIRCGEGSYLTIDDARRNVDKDGKEVLPEQGRISRDAVLQDGTEVKKGDRLTKLDSDNAGTLSVTGGCRASAIGGAALENSGNMTFNGGNLVVRAYGENVDKMGAGAGIGGGHAGGGTVMTFNGGRIDAVGSYHGAGIGGGCTYTGSMSGYVTYKLTDAIMCYTPSSTIAGDININGGYLISRGCIHSNAFGQGCGGSNLGKTIKITGGTLLPTSVSGWYDIGGAGGDVIVTGGSIRLSGNNKYQSSSNDGSAWGNEEKTIKVFMTKIDLSSESWSVDKYVESLQITMGGEVYNYGLPAAVDNSGCLYLWLPNNGSSQEVRAVLEVLNEDGKPIEMEPFFITNATNGSNLKRYVTFTVLDEVFSILEKKYDGCSIVANDISDLGMVSNEEPPKVLNNNSLINYTSQRLDEDGKEISEQETIGLPSDVGTWQITMTSSQYSSVSPFSNSYWGHRGYYQSVKITPADSETAVSYEQMVDDKSSNKVIQLAATVRPAQGEAKTCASPTGTVQFYINGVAVGEPVELEAAESTDGEGYHYSTAVYQWTPSEEDVVDYEDTYEVTAQYIGDVHGVNYHSSEGESEEDVEITPIDQESPIKITDVTDPEEPEDVTADTITKNFTDEKVLLKAEGGDSSKDFVYESSDPEIAEVDEETGEVIFKDFGEVTITVTKPGNVAYEDKTEKVTIIILPQNPTADDVEVSKEGENKSDPGKTAQVNDIITYTITVENKLIGSLWKDVVIKDLLPEGLELNEESLVLMGDDDEPIVLDGTYYNEETRVLAVPVGDVRGGQKYSLSFDVKVTEDAVEDEDGNPKDIGNVANVEGTDPEGEDVIGTTPEPVYPSEENKPENGGVLWADPEPEMEKTAENLTDPGEQAQVNDVIAYCIKVENKLIGSLWKNVVIRDQIPEGMELVKDSLYLTSPDGTEEKLSDEHYDDETRMLSVHVGEVYGGQQYLLKFEVTIKAEAVAKDIGNEADVEGEGPNGETITVGTPEPVYPSEADKPLGEDSTSGGGGVLWGDPVPELKKTAKNNNRSDGTVVVDDCITYTITVENKKEGSVWTNVAIRDRLPEGLLLDKDSMYLIKPNGEQIHVSASAYQEAERMISVYVGDVYGGEKYVFMFDVVITSSAVGNDIGNIAIAIGGKPSDSGSDGGAGPENGSGDGSGGSGSDGGWGSGNPEGWRGGYTTGGYEPGDPYYPEDDPFDELGEGTGDGTDKPVYPWGDDGEGDGEPTTVTPSTPEPELEKTVENETHSDGKTEENDILTYEIELSNPKMGSLWRNVMIFDYLPDELQLDLSSMTLQYPDGHIEKVRKDVYDAVTHMIKVPIKELWGGERYILRYKVKVVLNEEKPEKEEIVNRAEATGENPDGTTTSAGKGPSSSVAIKYPVVESKGESKDKVKEPIEVTPNTGDHSGVSLYVGMMFLCVFLFIACRNQICKKEQ